MVLQGKSAFYGMNLFEEAPFFYVKDGKVCVWWHYIRDHRQKLFVFPLLGPVGRRLLGIPDPYDVKDKEFSRLVSSLRRIEDTVLEKPDGFNQRTGSIAVLCSVVSASGGRPGIEGKILRMLPNPRSPDGTPIHLDFSEDYYFTTPVNYFDRIQIKLVSPLDYRTLNIPGTTSCILHFKPMNNCLVPDKEKEEDGVDFVPVVVVNTTSKNQ